MSDAMVDFIARAICLVCFFSVAGIVGWVWVKFEDKYSKKEEENPYPVPGFFNK